MHNGYRQRPEEVGEMYGVYHAIEHAEASGEILDASDIEVTYENLTHVFKRGKIDRSLQGPSLTRGVNTGIYNEVTARKRPLGSDV